MMRAFSADMLHVNEPSHPRYQFACVDVPISRKLTGRPIGFEHSRLTQVLNLEKIGLTYLRIRPCYSRELPSRCREGFVSLVLSVGEPFAEIVIKTN